MKRISIFFLTFLTAAICAFGQNANQSLYKESHALVIGNSEYQFWDKLTGVKADVPEVSKALQEQGFTVETEANLTSDKLKARVDKFISDYGLRRDSRLLIYFAGHGATYAGIGEDSEVGYIVPIDTPRMPLGSNISEQAEVAFLRKAISVDTFDGWAKNIKAKHVLFVFDSCFSGRFVPRSEIRPSEIVEDALEKPTRQFLTSGAANQTASDNSEFRKVFVQGLRGDADLTGDGFVTVTELAIFVRDRVAEYSAGKQTPQYGTIRESSLDGGDMVFRASTEFQRKNEAQAELAWKRVIKNDANSLREFIKIYSNTTRGREAIAQLGKLETQTVKRSSVTSTARPVQQRQPARNPVRVQSPVREQDSNEEIVSQTTPAKKVSITKDSVTFDIKACVLTGKDLVCSLKIFTSGEDTGFGFYRCGGMLVDENGNQVVCHEYSQSSELLVTNVPISASISFKVPDSSIKSLAVFEISYSFTGTVIEVSLRNVPVINKN